MADFSREDLQKFKKDQLFMLCQYYKLEGDKSSTKAELYQTLEQYLFPPNVIIGTPMSERVRRIQESLKT